MPKTDKFQPGDLVFARVKGYPAWPARITSVSSSKYKVFFYGTFETATLKNEDIWYFSEERAESFENKNRKRKGYLEGMDQIRNNPDIAIIQEIGSEGVIGQTGSMNLTIGIDEEGDSVSVGKAPSPSKPMKRKAEDYDEAFLPYKKLAMSPSVHLSKTKISDYDEYSSIKSYDSDHSETESKKSTESSPCKESNSTHILRDERKLWVRVKDTDDIIEINLDKDRPESFESDEARIEWENASARKALKFKKRIESGEVVPPEIQNKLQERAKLTQEERDIIDNERKLRRSKEKLRWLKIEQRLVELDIAVKTSLNLKKPSPDRCIQALDELQELGIAPLMLKKQPDIVTTVKRICKYVGPNEFRSWEDEDAVNKIDRSISIIQSKATLVFNKFKKCFNCQDDGDGVFIQKFEDEVLKLKKHATEMEESKVLSMIKDPTHHLSTSNPLSDLEDEE